MLMPMNIVGMLNIRKFFDKKPYRASIISEPGRTKKVLYMLSDRICFHFYEVILMIAFDAWFEGVYFWRVGAEKAIPDAEHGTEVTILV